MDLTRVVVGDGFVARYLDFVSVHEAPASYHVAALLGLFSAVLERRLSIRRGYLLRANLYCLLLGPPASRKTYTTRIVRQVLADAGVELDVVGENATDEGLLKSMKRQEVMGQSPVATIVCEELGTLLGKKKYQEGLAQFLCRAYDGGPLRNERSGDSYGTGDSFLSIVAATTPRALQQIQSSIIDTGLASRIWIIKEDAKARWVSWPRFSASLRASLASELANTLEHLLNQASVITECTEEAEELFDQWYMGPHRTMVEGVQEEAEGWAGRRHDHVMRAASLLHLIDGGDPSRMGETSIRRGIEYIEAMEPGMFEALGILGSGRWGIVMQRAMDIVKKKPKGIEIRHFKAGLARICENQQEYERALNAVMTDEEVHYVDLEGHKGIVWRQDDSRAPAHMHEASD